MSITAERRMFTKKITDSDHFTELPPTTQAFYFHLCMNADDDGFNNKIRQAMFNAHADRNDYELLIHKRFIIPFEDKGIIVIKHWKLHNYIQNDRYHKTEYVEEKARLILKANGVYTENVSEMDTECIQDVSNTDTRCIQNVSKMDTEVRLGKVSIDKDSKEKSNTGKNKFSPPTLEEVQAYCIERGNNVNPETFINFYESKGWMIGKNKMKNWKACIHTWEQKEQKPKKKTDEDVMREWLEEYGGEE